jgi:hypothetical protein
MTEVKKPSEKVLENPYDGKEITDKKGRKLKLRKPNILDRYDLFSAMGEDAKNPMCLSFAMPLLHVATIDNMVVESPRNIREFRAALVRLGDEGQEAIIEYINKVEDVSNEQEQKDKAKKL